MEKIEHQPTEKNLSDKEITFINKISAEFLQACENKEQLTDLILDKLTEKGKKVILEKINKSEESRRRIAFIGYLWQKSKEERDDILKVCKKLPEKSGFIGLGGSHDIISGITKFVDMIELERTYNGKRIYFKDSQEDFLTLKF